MAKFYDRVGMTTATTGTGTITLGSALTDASNGDYQTFASAGASTGDVIKYLITDGHAWETGIGTYTSSGTTLSRTLRASSSGSLLTLSGSAKVYCMSLGEDVAPDHPGYVSGRHYLTCPPYQTLSAAAVSANNIRLTPFFIKERVVISELGLRVTTLSASTHVACAMYRSDPVTFRPTTLIGNIASQSSASVATLSAALAQGNQTVDPGWYWYATNSDGGPSLVSVSATISSLAWAHGSTTQSSILTNSGPIVGLNVGSITYGTWSDLTSATFTEQTALYPVGTFKVA